MRYRKKPVVVEAMRILEGSLPDVTRWAHEGRPSKMNAVITRDYSGALVRTPEGRLWARFGDYIIKDEKGDFYLCKSDIFEQTYEPVDADYGELIYRSPKEE